MGSTRLHVHLEAEKYAPEPVLDQSIYEEIPKTVFDTGRVFERLPSTYADKYEETLRDHLILVAIALLSHFSRTSLCRSAWTSEARIPVSSKSR